MSKMVTKHFSHDELACPTTGEVKFAKGFLRDLEDLRVAYGNPMWITSGCRSREHNAKLIHDGLPAHPTSLHLIDNPKWGCDALAVDVARPGGIDLAKLLSCALVLGWSAGIARSFVHLDMRIKLDMKSRVYTYD